MIMTRAEMKVFKAKRKEEAIRQQRERMNSDMKWNRVLRNTPKFSASDLGLYRYACEKYAEKMHEFESGKHIVRKKEKGGKVKTSVMIKPHPPQPSFNKIYKAVLAGKPV